MYGDLSCKRSVPTIYKIDVPWKKRGGAVCIAAILLLDISAFTVRPLHLWQIALIIACGVALMVYVIRAWNLGVYVYEDGVCLRRLNSTRKIKFIEINSVKVIREEGILARYYLGLELKSGKVRKAPDVFLWCMPWNSKAQDRVELWSRKINESIAEASGK